MVSIVAHRRAHSDVLSVTIQALSAMFKAQPCSWDTASRLVPALLEVGTTAGDSSSLKLDVVTALGVLSLDPTVALLMPQFRVDHWVINMTMSLLGDRKYALATATLFATLAERNALLEKDVVTRILLCIMNPMETAMFTKDEEANILIWEQCCRTICTLLKKSPAVIASSTRRAFRALLSLMINHGMHPRLIGLELDSFMSFQKISLFFSLSLVSFLPQSCFFTCV